MAHLALIDDIVASTELLQNDEAGAREKLLSLSYALSASLETPSEAIQRIGWSEPARTAALRTAVDLKLFEQLSEAKIKALSASELAKHSDADPALVARLLKHLAAMHIVRETGPNQYVSSKLTDAFTEPRYRDGIVYTHDVAGPSFSQTPDYLRSTGYKNPTKLADGPFQFAHETKVPFFVWLGEKPEYLTAFNNYMMGYRQGKDEVLLVDVGGGLGHDLVELKANHPDLKGRLVLQDRPEVIDEIKEPTPGVELMKHDFFTEQPVKGAKVYFLHSVLHDWDDQDSIRILKQLAAVMRKGHSKILLNENILPDSGASWSITSMDWLMMALGAVRERTKKNWTDLLTSAGLKLVKVWTYEQGTESLIEAEL